MAENPIEIPFGKYGTVRIEPSSRTEFYDKTGWKEKVSENLTQSFEKIIVQVIETQCLVFADAFMKLQQNKLHPVKAETEFGLQFDAEGQIYIAKLSGGTNYKVKFEWDLAS